MKNYVKDNTLTGYLFAFLTITIWSGWTIMSRIGALGSLSPFDLVFMRYSFAGLIMLPTAIRNFHLINKQNYLGILVMIVGAGAPYLWFALLGFQRAPISHGILIPSAMPLFVAILSFMVFKERLIATRLLGYLFILCGIIFRLNNNHSTISSSYADIFFLIAALLWAIYTVQNKYLHLTPIVATSFVTCGSMFILIIPYVIYQYKHPHALPLIESTQQIIYQGFITSILSLITYNRAIEIIGAAKTSCFAALCPVMVTLLAIPFLHEIPNTYDWIFVIIMSIGVFLASGVLTFFEVQKKIEAPFH